MNPDKRIRRLTTWQVVLCSIAVGLFILRFLPLRPLSISTGAWNLARVGLQAICMIGVFGIEFYKKRLKTKPPITITKPPGFDV